MGLREHLAAHSELFEAVLAVATCRDSLGFGDLWFPPFDFDAELRRLVENRDPGVRFETASRIVVIEEYGGELRYYAGGWCPDQNRIYLEQDRIEAEGSELGVFDSARAAIAFVEQYLVQERTFQGIPVPRQVCYGHTSGTDEVRNDPGEPSSGPFCQ
jgi:hypothetical protein